MKNNSNLFTKDFILLIFTIFFATTGFFQLLPIIPLFATDIIHMEEGKIGIVIGAFSISALLARPLIGYMLDNYKKTHILSIVLILFSIALLAHMFIVNLYLLLLIRMIQGATWASITTSTNTLAMDLIPQERRAEGIGFFSLAMPAAMVVAPAVALSVLHKFNNFNLIFAISGILAIIATFLSISIHNKNELIIKRPLSLSPKMLYDKRVATVAVMQFCYSLLYCGTVAYLPIYVTKVMNMNSMPFFVVYALTIITSRFFARKTFDKRGPALLIVSGYACCGISALLLFLMKTPEFLILSGFSFGLGAGLIVPAFNTMSMNIVMPHERGRASATLFTAMDIGMGFGAVLFGYILEHSSFKAVYLTCIIIPIIAILYFICFEQKQYYKNIENLRKAEK